MKKFAKLMSVVLAIAMLFAMAIPVASVAAEGEVAARVETVEANAGDTGVSVKVFMGHEPHWSAVGYTFKFDASKLTYKLWSWSPALVSQLLAGKGFTSVINDEHVAEGELIVTFLTTTSVGGYEGYYPYAMDNTYSDYIGTITFDVAEGAKGLQEIAVTVDKLSTPTEGNVMVDVPATSENGGIKLPGGDEPPVPTNPVISGVTEGQEFDLSKEEKPAPTWEPAEATATLNGEPYTAGTEIAEAGDYTLVVSDDAGNSTTVNFKVVDGGEEPPEPFEGVEAIVETVEAAAGDTDVPVKVFMGHEPHWSAVGYTFKFDASKLTYKLWSWSPALVSQLLAGKGFTSVINDEHVAEGELIVTFLTTTSVGGYEGYYPYAMDNTYSDYIGTITFDVAEGAEDGLYEIAVTVDKLSTPTEGNVMVDVPSKGTNGGIKLGAPACEHDWVETGRTPATCTEAGSITYTCSKCPEIKEETIDPLGHDWGEWEVTTPATCTEKGEETRTCQREGCNETETGETEIDPEAHKWVEIGKTAATCAAKGVINYACENDPEHTKDEEIDIDPDAHDWGEWTDSPDKEGYEQRVCKNDPSHIEEREKGSEPPVHEHTFGEPTYTWANDNSTCTATRACTADGCDETETETVNATSETTPATTEADGKTVYTATFENSAFETQTKEVTIPKLEPEEPTAPAVTGTTDGQEFDLGKGEKPAPTWEPADATATLNGKPYTAGTAITEAGDYTLVVTNGDKTTTIKFKVTDSSATNPDQPNTSDLPVAGIAIVSLIAAAAVVVIARKKRFAR